MNPHEILDNPNFYPSIDKSGMVKVLESTPELFVEALKISEKIDVEDLREKEIFKVAFLGMGGSSIGGSLLKDWGYENIPIPIEICRDSVIPQHLDEHTLAFAVSYSGNTKETLDAFMKALEKKCLLVGVSSGGLLREYCLRYGIPYVNVPQGFQPRAALPYLFTPPAIILEKLGIIKKIGVEVADTITTLKNVREKIKASIPLNQNKAKNLALNIKDSFPVIYGFREYSSVAYRIKTQLNENSKIFCKFDVLPELNHNEVVGWENLPPDKANLFSVILLRDMEEPPEIKVRFEILKEILSQKTTKIFEVYGEGETKLAKMFSTLYLGDYLSFYLALLNQVDPTPIKTINHLKKELEKRLK